MRLAFIFLCVAGAACVVDGSSRAGPSSMVTSSAGIGGLADLFVGGHSRVHDKPTDEEQAISVNAESIAGAAEKNLPIQVKKIVHVTTEPAKLAESEPMYTIEELFDAEDLLDKMVYKDTGFQQVANLVVSNAEEVKFKEINHLVVSFHMDKLEASRTADELDDTFRQMYSAFCTGGKEFATSFVLRLKDIRRNTNEVLLTWLKEEKTPYIALNDMKYDAPSNLFEWRHVRPWVDYMEAYNVVYYKKRSNVVAATKLSDKDLLDMVVKTDVLKPKSTRWSVLNGLIDYWHELKYTPAQIYDYLGCSRTAGPKFDSSSC